MNTLVFESKVSLSDDDDADFVAARKHLDLVKSKRIQVESEIRKSWKEKGLQIKSFNQHKRNKHKGSKFKRHQNFDSDEDSELLTKMNRLQFGSNIKCKS